MDTLNLLWELETHNLILNQLKSELKTLKESISIEELKGRLDDIDSQYGDKITRLEDMKEKIRKSDIVLRNQDFLYEEKKNLLYQGNIIDIKQLEQLDKEEKEIKLQIDNMESEIIKNLQEVDSIEVQIEEIKIEVMTIEKDIKIQVDQLQKEMDNLLQEIFKEKEHISLTSSKIDKKTLDTYEKIRKYKSNAMVAVIDNICSGCNMRIPSYQKKPLYEGEEIIMCESCGRILYREKLNN